MVLIHVKTENEKLKMTAAEAEAINQLMNIYLDETEDTMEKHLGTYRNWADGMKIIQRKNCRYSINIKAGIQLNKKTNKQRSLKSDTDIQETETNKSGLETNTITS